MKLVKITHHKNSNQLHMTERHQGVDSLIILGAWTIWNHRNGCVFNGATPNLAGVLIITGEERRLWSMAGARGLSFLTALLPSS
jgi:hypothetical protein